MYVEDLLAARNSPRGSIGSVANEVPIPNGFRESQLSYSMKTVVKQGDPEGIRAWMRASGTLDGLGDGVGSFRPDSVSSGYSLLSNIRVSQQLERMSFGSMGGWLS